MGTRGSGKSAVLQIYGDRLKKTGSIVITMSPDDYSYEILSTNLKKESEGSWGKQGAYTAAWKYLLYVTVMKEINAHAGGLKTGSAKRIYEYLRDNHKGEQKNPIAILISYLKRLEGFKVGSWEASAKTQELQKLYRLEEIHHLIPDLQDLLSRFHIVFLIDELDRGWDSSEDAKKFVSGLFHAVNELNNLSPSHLKIFIGLRQELYQNIPELYDDAQKIRDLIEHVRWDEEGLKKLITERIKFVFKLSDTNQEKIWNHVFSEVLDYRSAKSFNYVVDRTLYRPREIIEFVNRSLEKSESLPINYQVLSRAELEYSKERLQDIATEYRFQYPGLQEVFETFRGLKYTFGSNDLELHCVRIITGEFSCQVASAWLENLDASQLIKILWDIGFIKAQAAGGLKAQRRSGSEYLGSHQIEYLNLQTIPYFHVHPMFRTYLAMKEKV